MYSCVLHAAVKQVRVYYGPGTGRRVRNSYKRACLVSGSLHVHSGTQNTMASPALARTAPIASYRVYCIR